MRNPVNFGLAAALAACLASFHASASEWARPLSGRELQMLLLGNTLIGADKEGPFWMYYANADTVWGRSSGGDVDVGRWWIENQSYCRAWRRWFAGETRCWQIAAVGQDTLLWYSLDGEPVGRSMLRRGNAIGDLPRGGSTSGQLADAGSGLASALDAVVARAELEPFDDRSANRGPQSDGSGRTKVDRPLPPTGSAGPAQGLASDPPTPPVIMSSESTAANRATASAVSSSSTAGIGRAGFGGFVDRLGAGSTGGADSGGSGGGGREAKGGTDRD